ncbi:hypothetical protein PFISCL1PPCAC_21925, partial [Pristionchus fissidentatus]
VQGEYLGKMDGSYTQRLAYECAKRVVISTTLSAFFFLQEAVPHSTDSVGIFILVCSFVSANLLFFTFSLVSANFEHSRRINVIAYLIGIVAAIGIIYYGILLRGLPAFPAEKRTFQTAAAVSGACLITFAIAVAAAAAAASAAPQRPYWRQSEMERLRELARNDP